MKNRYYLQNTRPKVTILFRLLPNNRYTISALIGLLDETLDPKLFEIGTIEQCSHLETLNLKLVTVVLAYSFTSPDFPAISKEIRTLKKKYGNKLVIICGGPHTSALPKQVLKAGADAVFIGEVEESLPKFLKELRKIGVMPKERIIKSIPLKDFDSYPPFAYKRRLFAPIELRRGCNNRCSFCQTPRIFPIIREHGIPYILKYARYIKTLGWGRLFFTVSDALAYGSKGGKPNLKNLEKLLKGLSKMGLKIHLGNFPSEISPRSLAQNPQALIMLKQYITNRKIIVGGQSASERILKLMKRNHSVRDIEDSVKILSQNGFKPIVDIILGIPGEKYIDRIETINFIRKLSSKYQAKFNIHYFMPLPGTPFAAKKPAKIEKAVTEQVHQLFRDGIAHGIFSRIFCVKKFRENPASILKY